LTDFIAKRCVGFLSESNCTCDFFTVYIFRYNGDDDDKDDAAGQVIECSE